MARNMLRIFQSHVHSRSINHYRTKEPFYGAVMTPRKPTRLRCNVQYKFQHSGPFYWPFPPSHSAPKLPSHPIFFTNLSRLQRRRRPRHVSRDSRASRRRPYSLASREGGREGGREARPGAGGSGSPGILSARHYQFQTRANPTHSGSGGERPTLEMVPNVFVRESAGEKRRIRRRWPAATEVERDR